MSEALEQGSTETQAEPTPKPLTAREAAQRLVQAKQEKAQELSQAVAEPQPEPIPEPNAEPAPEPQPAEAEAIDYASIDFAEVAAPVAERDQDQTTGDDSPAPVFTLKHNGQEQQVNQQEAIDLAQMGLDYRKKTQDLAEQRRSFESEREAFAQQMKGLQEDREKLAAQLQNFTQTVQPPSPDLAETDPDEFNAQMAKYNAQQMQAEQAAKELDAQREKDQEAHKRKQQEAYQAHMQRLHSRVPDMAKKEVSHAVGNYLVKGIGFSGDELIQGVVAPADSRFQEMAWKAMQYDIGRSKAKTLRPSAPSTSASGQRTGMSQQVQKPSREQLRNPRAAADFLKARKEAR